MDLKQTCECENDTLSFTSLPKNSTGCRLEITDSESKPLPGGHTVVVPLLPIPNRTVKRLWADDSWLYFQ